MLVNDFVDELKKLGFDFFAGVPCSFFKSVINYVIDDSDVDYHMASNEGVALAMASGAYLAGRVPLLMIQNSGLGNLVNPLTSLSMIYKMPVLLLISGRHYKVKDEPQHFIMGTRMTQILDGIGLAYHELPKDNSGILQTIQDAKKYLQEHGEPFALIVPRGTFSEYSLRSTIETTFKGPLMNRLRVLEIVTGHLKGDEILVSTTGIISRLLYVVNDQPQNFYMQGSMGHAISIGLGIALVQKERKVVVLDGDGATIMHMGALSTVGHFAPKNLLHMVLDNEAYETTGGQYTSSGTTDLTAVAHACGYRNVITISEEQHLKDLLQEKRWFEDGPSFVCIKISRERALSSIPRITEKYTVEQTCENVRDFLKER